MSDPYAASLEAHGLEDVQPLYRRLLVRLKSENPEAYEQAVARYREEVESAVDDAADPLSVWVGYGTWLAPRVSPGSLKAVNGDGLATDVAEEPPLGPLLMHLPDDPKQRGIVLAMPADPSPAQRETAALLCA